MPPNKKTPASPSSKKKSQTPKKQAPKKNQPLRKKSSTKESLKKIQSIYRIEELIKHTLNKTQVFFTLFLSACVTLVLIFFIAWQFFTQSNFSEHIPANTQKFLHVNIKHISPNVHELLLKFIQSPLQETDLLRLQNLGLSFITFIESTSGENSFFIEGISSQKVREFLKPFSSLEEHIESRKENNFEIFTIQSGREIYCFYKKRTLYCSSSQSPLNSYAQERFSPLPEVKKDMRNIQKGSVTWFANSQALSQPFLQAHRNVIQKVYGSFQVKDSENIEAQIYAYTNKDFPSTNHTFSRQNLGLYFPLENTNLFLSGNNFEGQWKNTEEFYTTYSSSYALILKGILQKKVKQYFGSHIDFYKDILPLFQGTYAFGVLEDKNKQKHLSFISETNDFQGAEKLLEAFFQERGQFTVEKQFLKVSEDLILEKVRSNEEKLSKVSERHGAARIIGYSIKEEPWGIYIAQKGSFLFASSSLEVLKTLLQRENESIENLFPHKQKNAYEFAYIDINSLRDIFSFIPFQLPFIQGLEYFDSLSWESQSHPQGISISSIIRLKEKQSLESKEEKNVEYKK